MTEQEQWSETWNRLGATAPEGLLTEIVARYSEPHRFYHTLQHLRECFSVLDLASHLGVGVRLLLFAFSISVLTEGQIQNNQSLTHLPFAS